MTPRTDYDPSGVQRALNFSDDEIIVDSFAGGGGASLGIQWATGRSPDIAINHDKPSISLHKANHPETEHYPEDVWHVDPKLACRGRKVGLMWLSPDCKHFSKAKGGKPVSKKLRGLAWTAVRWARAVKPRVIMLENVEEFEQWGPLYPADYKVVKLRNRPIPEKKGLTFNVFVGRLRRLGYNIEWRTMRACDYGAPTIRNRFFMIARCDGLPIVWPAPTHGKGRPQPWRTAAECIDWSIECPSIFDREERGKKRLAVNTERRIARGVMKFVMNSPNPFIVGVGGRMGQSPERGVDRPFQTLTAKADSAVVVPYVVGAGGPAYQGEPRSADLPHRTILAESNAALVSPCLVRYNGAKKVGDDRVADLQEPLPTQPTENRFGLVAPHLVRVSNGEADANGRKRGKGERELTEPFGTQLATNTFGLVAPFLKPRYGEDPDPSRGGGEGQSPRVRSLEEPAPTIVPSGNGGDLVATFLAKHYKESGNQVHGSAMDQPVHTVTQHDHNSLVETRIAATHIQRDFGHSVGSPTDEPVGTITPGGSGKAALVASHLIHLRGTGESHLHGDSLDEPMRTISAGGTHAAKVCAFLFAYYGTQQQTGDLREPSPTLTAKDRFGLVTLVIAGVEYVIVDIGMRMLQPRELYRAQGFPDTYLIDIEHDYEIKPRKSAKVPKKKSRRKAFTAPPKFIRKQLTKTDQVKMCGNSVPPHDAMALVGANCGYLVRRERVA